MAWVKSSTPNENMQIIDFDGVDNGNYNNTKYLHPWISEFSRVSCEEAETYSETLEVFLKRA